MESARTSESIVAKVGAAQADATAAAAAIARITEVVDRISSIQITIAGAVEEQTATTGEMVRNVDEIAAGSADVTRSISGVADDAGRTTHDAERTAAAAAAVATTAGRLDAELRKFRV